MNIATWALSGMLTGCTAAEDATGEPAASVEAVTSNEQMTTTSDDGVGDKGDKGALIRVSEGDFQPYGAPPRCGVSFTQSCIGWYYEYYENGPVFHAKADLCERRDGSWGGKVEWRGSCGTDVRNNNGNIGCK